MKLNRFWVGIVVVLLAGLAFTKIADNEFYFYAIYAVMQLSLIHI